MNFISGTKSVSILKSSETILVALFVSWIGIPVSAAANTFQWETARPESQGMSSRQLQQMTDTLTAHGTTSLLVIRNDQIIHEWYAAEWGPNRRHYTASLAKALVGGTSLQLALDQGVIYPDAPACYYIPDWKSHPQKSKITIRDLATHTSGIEDAEPTEEERQRLLEAGESRTNIHMNLPGWKGIFWRKDPDPFTVSRDSTPVLFTPGTDYAYSNPGMAMLSYAVTSALARKDTVDIRTLLRRQIMEPVGIPEDAWSIGYGNTYEVDGLPLVANWGGGSFTPRAVARVGRLMLNKGKWQGEQLLSESWVKEAVTYHGTALPDRTGGDPVPASGLCWYTNFDGVWREVPRDAFAGAGAGNQVLLVVPSRNLIVVRMGSDLVEPGGDLTFWGACEKYVFNPAMRAIVEPPYPESEYITQVEFDPPSAIIRQADGSDNWPLTWGDDNALYTAYGDGWGFRPRTEIKLSLGLARITGTPPDFQGENIRSETGERVGDGSQGPKASGMLMVDEVLYMLVRNADNSTLAWSDQHGETWKWADWNFRISFGYPTFLNFGRNYSNARDEYVYIYSHDDDSAYQPADHMVLARVPQGDIRDWRKYQFFAGMTERGTPVWTEDVRKRRPVFVNPGQCYRSGITYNAGLERYLWCQIIPGEDTRFAGGFGIYESKTPWGPWRTVFYTREWDTGPGETMSIPTKWMSKDGRTCWLVFSGEDSFSARRVTFTISNRE